MRKREDWEAFLDSGSMVSLVREVLANTPRLEAETAIACIHGDTKCYPTVRVSFHYPCREDSPYRMTVPVPLGRDCPLFKLMWRKEG